MSSFEDSEGVVGGLGRIEVSPGKVGEGLFPMSLQEPQISEEALSSEEENLIAQSTFEIKNIFEGRTRPGFCSRFAEAFGDELINTSEENEHEQEVSDIGRKDSADVDESESLDGRLMARRLRIFEDITD